MTILDRPNVVQPIDYPESDGSLIAESDWHRDELFDLIHRLKARYADSAETYISGHMFVYYEAGDPASVFAPDVMVVFGVTKTPRRVYKLWEEGTAPAVVFEVSSRKTWMEDQGNKRVLCERLGVAEYFLWDPRYEYLTPALQGLRLVGGTYREIRPAAGGCLVSKALGLRLCCEKNRLELYDRRTGARLNRPADEEAMARQAEAEVRRLTEAVRRAGERAEAAEGSQRALQAEVERLRAEIASLRGGG